MSSKVLADARRFLTEEGVTPSSPSVLSATLLPMSSPGSVTAASSASSSTWSTPTADEANQQFIISILDDNLHGAYEQELFDLRTGRFTGALSLDRLLADDPDDGGSSNGTYSNGRPIARRPSSSAATPSRAARPSLSRAVAEASIGRGGGGGGRVGPSPYARPSSAASQPRRSSNIGTPARASAANGVNRRSTLSPRAISGSSSSSSSKQAKCALPPSYESEAELKRDFDAVLPDLASDRGSSWEKQTAALDALSHMLSATESDETFIAVLGSPLLVRALVELLKSPRSALVRHATSVVTKLTERLVLDQRWRRREAPDMLGALQQTLASRINVISECARDSLVALAHTLPGSVLLPAVRGMCASVRDARLRRIGAELLAILLDRNGGGDVDEADAPVVQALVVSLLTDADPEARRNARACFAAFCDAFPALAPEIEAQLDPEARRVVERGGLTTPRRQSPASTAVSPAAQSASRLRQPSASARPSTTPRRLSNPPSSSPPPSSSVPPPRRESTTSTASRIKPPSVFARPTSASAATGAAAAPKEARKPNIRRPVTRKLFLGEDRNDADEDDNGNGGGGGGGGEDDVAVAEPPAVVASTSAVTPPQRSRSNSLEWFDSLTSSPAVNKPEGLLADDVAVNDFTPDDESLLRAAAAQLLAEQQATTAPAPAVQEEAATTTSAAAATTIDDEPNEW